MVVPEALRIGTTEIIRSLMTEVRKEAEERLSLERARVDALFGQGTWARLMPTPGESTGPGPARQKRPAETAGRFALPSNEGLCRELTPPGEECEAEQTEAEEPQAGRFGEAIRRRRGRRRGSR